MKRLHDIKDSLKSKDIKRMIDHCQEFMHLQQLSYDESYLYMHEYLYGLVVSQSEMIKEKIYKYKNDLKDEIINNRKQIEESKKY